MHISVSSLAWKGCFYRGGVNGGKREGGGGVGRVILKGWGLNPEFLFPTSGERGIKNSGKRR